MAACEALGAPDRGARLEPPRPQERPGTRNDRPVVRKYWGDLAHRYRHPDWTGSGAARILDAVAGRLTETPTQNSPHDRRIRRSWWFLAGSFFVLGLVTLLRLLTGMADRIDWILAGLVVVVGLAVVIHREAVAALEEGRRSEAESFARILQGLSRSVSPDAIVEAIVEEVGAGTGADHVVVVRLRPGTEILEATLVSQRPGVPNTSTVLPAMDMETAQPAVTARRIGTAAGLARHGADPMPGSSAGDGVTAGVTGLAGEPVPAAVAVGSRRIDRPGRAAPVAAHATAHATAPAGGSTAVDVRARPILPAPPPDVRAARDGAIARSAPAVHEDVAPARRATDRMKRPDRRRTWSALGASAAVRAMTARGAGRTEPSSGPPSGGGPAARIADEIATRVQAVYGLKHTIAAPLVAGSAVVGAIVLSRRTADPWPVAAQRILGGAAMEASAALERVYSHRAAEARAATDALTGLPNRRYFEEFCGLLARRRRADDAIGVLMIDIDRFKSLNDSHGHAMGDHVLRNVAEVIAGAVRDDDVPARYGGEEFAVLLRNPTPAIALEVGERVRRAVASLDLRSLRVDGVTVSVGIAVSDVPDQPMDELIERADRALYAAKRAGRNRVVAA
jgi:diguanylate cyclase (GGDEF)-like protein